MCIGFVLKETQVAPVSNALIFPTGHAADFLDGQPGAAQSPPEDVVYCSPIECEGSHLAWACRTW